MSYNHDYYLKHKEEYRERYNKWRKENKEQFSKIVYRYRKKRAKELREKGEMYCWLSETKRKELNEKRNRRINQDVGNGEIQDNIDE